MTKARPFMLEAAYAPVSKRACSRSAKTRSLTQKPACKGPWVQWLKPSHHTQGPLHSGF